MKFKPKLLIDKLAEAAESSDLDITEAVRSLSPLPRSSIQTEDSSTSDLDQLTTKLQNSPSPIRSADEDSGVGGSPGSGSRSTTSTSHSCHMCNKKFSRADILRKHVKTHVNSSCTVCGFICNDKVALAKHQVEVHTLDRVFQCPQCEKGFKELRTLRLHLKIHNAEYPEQCGVCQKVFRTKWQLKQHQMDHGGERPYPCPECSFTCKTKQQLNEHRRKHSGEKAYSCAQCGTRFTYRNGLIKHTKLNRCPKTIVTPEGETIIKKRSRSFNTSKSKEQQQQPPRASESAVSSPQEASFGLTSPSLPSPIALPNNQDRPSFQKPVEQAPVAAAEPPQPTFYMQSQQIQLNGDTYGLAVLEDGSLVATPQVEHPKQQEMIKFPESSTSQLSPQVIAALSAATGLPPQEICSWAASLPAGSTVRVTHHFDHSVTSSPVKPILTADSTVRVTHQYSPASPAKSTADNQPSRSYQSTQTGKQDVRVHPYGSPGKSLMRHRSVDQHAAVAQRPNLALEMATACHDSLISACVGLPSYQESFAVDPNEILSKDRPCTTSKLATMIKDEPPMTPNTDDLNNNYSGNNFVDDSLSSMISDDLGSYFGFPEEASKPSVINMANSRLLHSHVIMSESSLIKQEPESSPQHRSDLDLDIFPDTNNMWQPHGDVDMDLVGFNLNDQDFTSIKTIVEQTFRDGRDVLDIISTV